MRKQTHVAWVPLLAGLVLVWASPLQAGGPLANCESGRPFLWPGGGANIPFSPDQGGLGPLTNAQAVAQTTESFAAWGAIPSASATYATTGLLPVDVDETNFGPFLLPAAPDGLSAIVYDEDGAIFNLLFGPGTGVLGFAGPEWIDPASCTIVEGVAFLNGGTIFGGFPAEEFKSVQVHEFGHYSNLAHTVVNGQVGLGVDTTGPTPFNTFPPENLIGRIETMYPFLLIDGGQSTPHRDDVAIFSTLYPTAAFLNSTGAIRGTIFAPNGTTRLSGANVIARNLADPFDDAVSAISGDFTDSTSQADPLFGTYALNGLTPGADYAVFVDQILAGGFSTPPLTLLGPEEFWNQGESNNLTSPDVPSVFTAVSPGAGSPAMGIDIVFNQATPGEPLPVGDDGFVQLFLPFTFCLAGQPFEAVFVNANGNLSFGRGVGDWSESAGEMLGNPPRIAGVWDDLSPFNPFIGVQQGLVTYDQTADGFRVIYENVPEYPSTGSNSFTITLQKNTRKCVRGPGDDDDDDDDGGGPAVDVVVEYGGLTLGDGLAGVSAGAAVTSGFEAESDLSALRRRIRLKREAAVYEVFTTADNDLAGSTLRYDVGRGFQDRFERNNTVGTAHKVRLPFDTVDAKRRFSEIRPAGGDVDYFRFELEADTTFIAETVSSQADTLIGLFRCVAVPRGDDDDDDGDDEDDDGDDEDSSRCRDAVLVAFDDDSGAGLLSSLQVLVTAAGTYALAVTTWPDFDFSGDGNTDPVFGVGRYVVTIDSVRGRVLNLGDDNFQAVDLGFSFPYQGMQYSSVFVNSNGNLTFGSGDSDWTESVPEFLNEQPRIAPLWDDLSPNRGGRVVATSSAGCLTLSWLGVPEFLASTTNSFAVTLDESGAINFDYADVAATDGLAGITPGAGAPDPGESDLSAGGPFPVARTTYLLFGPGDPNDLDNRTVVFGSLVPLCGQR